jgi:hypothetical protein
MRLGSNAVVRDQWSNLFSAQLNLVPRRGQLATVIDATMTAARIGSPSLRACRRSSRSKRLSRCGQPGGC